MYVAFFARRAAFSLMSMLVMLWSHARLLLGARFLFFMCRPCVRSLVSLVLLLSVSLTVSVSLSVSFLLLLVRSVFLSVLCPGLWGMRLLEVTLVLMYVR